MGQEIESLYIIGSINFCHLIFIEKLDENITISKLFLKGLTKLILSSLTGEKSHFQDHRIFLLQIISWTMKQVSINSNFFTKRKAVSPLSVLYPLKESHHAETTLIGIYEPTP